MMTEHIRREDAREAIWRILNGMGYSQKHNDRLVEEVDAVLEDYPAADVREVVYCRDCKAYGEMLTGYDERVICHKFALTTKPDDFCSCGEKREES